MADWLESLTGMMELLKLERWMRLNLKRQLLGMAMTIGFSTSGGAQAGAQGEKAWRLEQESCTVGAIELLVSAKALKWSCAKLGLTLIMHAPKWDVIAYNENTKKYMGLSTNEVQQLFGRKRDELNGREGESRAVFAAAGSDRISRLHNGQMSICGVPTFEYRVPKKYSAIGPDAASSKSVAQSKSKLDVSSRQLRKVYDSRSWSPGDEDCWVAASIDFPEAVAQKIAWHGLDGRHPILRSVFVGKDGNSAMALDTTVCKRVPVTPTMFELPKGLVRTTSEMSLMVEDSDLEVFAGAQQCSSDKGAKERRAPGAAVRSK
jgi:hypothetical protein